MKKCKICGVTHDQNFNLKELKRKAEIVNNIEDKKIEIIIDKFVSQPLMSVTQETEWLRETLLNFQKEIREEIFGEIIPSKFNCKGFNDCVELTIKKSKDKFNIKLE